MQKNAVLGSAPHTEPLHNPKPKLGNASIELNDGLMQSIGCHGETYRPIFRALTLYND